MTDDKNRPPRPPFSPVFVENGETPPPPEPPEQQSNPQSPQDHDDKPRPNMHEAKELRAAQNLVMVGSIAGPVSLFIGGVVLSTAGVVCALLGLRKLNALAKRKTEVSLFAFRLRRSAVVALAICGVALVLNAISFIVMFPLVMEAVESGDYGDLIPNVGGTGSTSSGTNSTWG